MADGGSDEGIDELQALEAIYGDECEVSLENRSFQMYLPSREACPKLQLTALLPDTYPASAPPVLQLQAPYLSDDTIEWVARHLEDMFVPGEVVMYMFVEWLKEQESVLPPNLGSKDVGQQLDAGSCGQWEEEEDDERLASVTEGAQTTSKTKVAGRYVGEEEALVDEMALKIVSGQALTERKSTFQAHVAPVTSYAQVKAVVSALLRVNKIANATHNIMAYRIHVPDKQAFLQDADDDGEDAAGGRLLHLLQVAGARNVVVVVSRWFGGVHLGPSRFALINNTARQLLEELGYISAGGDKKAGAKGKK